MPLCRQRLFFSILVLMKNCRSFLAGALLILAAIAAANESAGDLSELARAALKNNPDLAAQQSALDAIKEGDNIALAPLLPQVATSANLIDNNFGNRGGGVNNANDINLSLDQQVFNLPLWKNYESEKSKTLAAESRFNFSVQALQLSVVSTWLDFQLAGDLVLLTRARLTVAQEQLTRAEGFVQAGIGTIVDVLDAKARLSAVNADLLLRQYNTQLAQDRLINISQIQGQPAQLNDAALAGFIALPTLDNWLLRVYNGSPMVAAAKYELVAATHLMEAARGSLFPRLRLSIRGSAPSNFSNKTGSAMLIAEQSIFSGGQIWAEKRKLIANLNGARHRVSARRRQDELQARQLHGQALLEQSRQTALAAAEEAARAALEATKAGYEGGARIIADVLDAEETLFDTRLQLRESRYNYLRNVVALHALAGLVDNALINKINSLFKPHQNKEITNV